MEIHILYAGGNYWYEEHRLELFIVEGIKKYNIKKVMVTKIDMWRRNLITKEKMENYCKGEKSTKESVNDDFESLFEDIRLGKKPKSQMGTYFLPKLTTQELKLVARKRDSFMHTFLFKMGADVSEAEMKLSESDSKFVRGICRRKTFTIENS